MPSIYKWLSGIKQKTLIQLSIILPVVVVVTIMNAGNIYSVQQSHWKGFIDTYMHDESDRNFIDFVLCCLATFDTLAFFGSFFTLIFFAISPPKEFRYKEMVLVFGLLGAQCLKMIHAWQQSDEFAVAGVTQSQKGNHGFGAEWHICYNNAVGTWFVAREMITGTMDIICYK